MDLGSEKVKVKDRKRQKEKAELGRGWRWGWRGGGGVITLCWLLQKVSTPKISKLACRQEGETERHEKKKRNITVDLIT